MGSFLHVYFNNLMGDYIDLLLLGYKVKCSFKLLQLRKARVDLNVRPTNMTTLTALVSTILQKGLISSQI